MLSLVSWLVYASQDSVWLVMHIIRMCVRQSRCYWLTSRGGLGLKTGPDIRQNFQWLFSHFLKFWQKCHRSFQNLTYLTPCFRDFTFFTPFFRFPLPCHRALPKCPNGEFVPAYICVKMERDLEISAPVAPSMLWAGLWWLERGRWGEKERVAGHSPRSHLTVSCGWSSEERIVIYFA